MSPDAYRLHSKGSTVPHGLGVQRSNLSLSQASALASGMSKFNTPGEKALSTGLGIAGKIPGLGWLGEAAIRGVQTASYMSKTDPYGSKPPSGGFEDGPSPEQHRKTPKAYASYQPNKTTLATAPSTRRRESTMSAGNVFRRGKEQPELKGTLPPTKITKTKVKTKRRTKEQILLDRAKEKKAALKKAHQKQKDFLNHQVGK